MFVQFFNWSAAVNPEKPLIILDGNLPSPGGIYTELTLFETFIILFLFQDTGYASGQL